MGSAGEARCGAELRRGLLRATGEAVLRGEIDRKRPAELYSCLLLTGRAPSLLQWHKLQHAVHGREAIVGAHDGVIPI